MKKIKTIFLLGFLMACSPQWTMERQNFDRFKDIPVPEYSIMDKGETSVIGDNENWWGVLQFSVSHGISQTFDYYLEEMKKFGWEKMTFSKGETTVYSAVFTKNERVAQILFTTDSLGSTIVKVIMSPRTTGMGGN